MLTVLDNTLKPTKEETKIALFSLVLSVFIAEPQATNLSTSPESNGLWLSAFFAVLY
jgi:hypothetical protein